MGYSLARRLTDRLLTPPAEGAKVVADNEGSKVWGAFTISLLRRVDSMGSRQ